MNYRVILTAMLALALQGAVQAQDRDLAELRKNIDLLTGVLEDTLDLNTPSGLFGISVGGVEGTYLHSQGVVLELRSPLANRRNRLELVSLNNAMQSLAARGNSFDAVRNDSSADDRSDDTADSAAADSFYQQMMERVANIDFSLIVSNALQQASDAARSLRSMGDMDDEDYARLRAELDEIRQHVQDSLAELRNFEQSLRENNEVAVTPEPGAAQTLSERLDSLVARIEPLREEATDLARELQARNEAATARYEQRWRQDLADLENALYQALCDFGASLRAMPDDEYVSIILIGLGEENEDNVRRDKVHVLAKSEIQQCQNGAIDITALLERSTQYSY